MNKRFKQIRTDAKLTQVEFGKRIGLARNYVYILESGSQPITNRTVADVCRAFGVREEWLRTGEEPMYLANSKVAQAIEWAAGTLAGEDSFKKRLLEVLARLDEEDWVLIERMIDRLSEKENPEGKEPSGQ